jgi:hypothetical protein
MLWAAGIDSTKPIGNAIGFESGILNRAFHYPSVRVSPVTLHTKGTDADNPEE